MSGVIASSRSDAVSFQRGKLVEDALPRRQWAPLLAVMAAGLLLRLYEFRGFGVLDDAAYAQIANQISRGTFRVGAYQGPAVVPLRLGIIYPTAMLFRWFGVNDTSVVLFPFILSLLSILLTYVAAQHFFGRRAALIGAGLWALLPLDAFNASILVPDLTAAFFQSLGVLAILIAITRATTGFWSLSVTGLAVGLAFGLSWLSKESIAFAAPVCAFLLIWSLRKDWRRYLPLWSGVIVGSAMVLGLEMTFYHRATGDWLFHFHETERNYRQYPNAFLGRGSSLMAPAQQSYAKAVLKRLLIEGPWTIFMHSQFLFLPLIAAIVSVRALYWRDRAYLLPALWFGSLVFMFNFASSSVSSYVPLVLFERYLYPIMLPAVVVVSGFLATLLFDTAQRGDSVVRRERRFWGVLTIAALLLVAVEKNYLNRKYRSGWLASTKTLSTILKPTDRLYTDILTINGLEFFWRYPNRMNVVNFEDMTVTPQPGDYVVANKANLNWLVDMAGWWPTEHTTYVKPTMVEQPPASWETTWRSDDAALYRVR